MIVEKAETLCPQNLFSLGLAAHTDQRLRVFTPEGKQIATIHVDANVTNAAFGGADGKTLFITGAGAVWQVKLGISGAPY